MNAVFVSPQSNVMLVIVAQLSTDCRQASTYHVSRHVK